MLKSEIKRRRTTRQIREQKAAAAELENASKRKIQQFDAMAAELQAIKSKAKSDESAANILTEMLRAGQLRQNEDGSISNPFYSENRRKKE